MEESIKKERFSREKCVLGAAAANRVVGWMLREIHMGKPGTAEKAALDEIIAAVRAVRERWEGQTQALPRPTEEVEVETLAKKLSGENSPPTADQVARRPEPTPAPPRADWESPAKRERRLHEDVSVMQEQIEQMQTQIFVTQGQVVRLGNRITTHGEDLREETKKGERRDLNSKTRRKQIGELQGLSHVHTNEEADKVGYVELRLEKLVASLQSQIDGLSLDGEHFQDQINILSQNTQALEYRTNKREKD